MAIEVFTSLDLEMNQPSRRIIQIGACVGNIKTGTIFEKLSVFVNPLEHLNPAITDLTKITQQDVDGGVTLEEAYRKLQKMHENYSAFVNPITWGGGDSRELLDQLQADNPHFEGWCFGRRHIDVKTLFVSWRFARGEPIQGGLARSMIKLGLKFDGQKHDGCDDAVNTFKMFCAMLKKFRE
ncbi:MAG: exonuclease domain-containing protein [Candidatus Methanoperedens sp.]|nr:exonuclease domain-containing protein [Candidatus Methanoperedens sp.]